MRTVLLVDDDADLRFMLRHLIESNTTYQVVGEAGNGEEAITNVDMLRPDMVIMDVAMPVMDGIEATRRIRDVHPDLYILGLTAFGEYPEHMTGAGANRCLLKTDSYGELTNLMTKLQEEQQSGQPWY